MAKDPVVPHEDGSRIPWQVSEPAVFAGRIWGLRRVVWYLPKEVVMAKRSLVSEAVEHYVFNIIARETPLQKRLREETARLPEARMQIGPDQGAMMAMLVRLIGRGERWKSARSRATVRWRWRPRCRKTAS